MGKRKLIVPCEKATPKWKKRVKMVSNFQPVFLDFHLFQNHTVYFSMTISIQYNNTHHYSTSPPFFILSWLSSFPFPKCNKFKLEKLSNSLPRTNFSFLSQPYTIDNWFSIKTISKNKISQLYTLI